MTLLRASCADLARSRWSLVVGWALTRLAITALTMAPVTALGPPGNADVVSVYHLWHHLLYAGAWPWRDFDVEYPVGILPLLALPGRGPSSYGAWFLAAALVVDAATLVTLNRSGRWLPAWGWVILPLSLGPLFWGRLDVFVAAALVGVGLAASRRRFKTALLLILCAASLKLWPILLVVPVIRAAPRAQRLALALGAGSVTFLAALATADAGMLPGLMRMLSYHEDRGLETESLWALPLLVLSPVIHGLRIVSAFGSNDVVGPGSQTLVAASTTLFIAGIAAWVLWVALRAPEVSAASAALIVIVLACSKVFSAQYVAWMIGGGVLLLDRQLDGRRLWLALASSGLAVQLTLANFTPMFKIVPLTPMFAALHGAALAYGLLALALIVVQRKSVPSATEDCVPAANTSRSLRASHSLPRGRIRRNAAL